MSHSIFDARFPAGHGGHGTRHMLTTVMSRAFSALLRKAYLPLGRCALARSSSLQNRAIKLVPVSGKTHLSVFVRSGRAQETFDLGELADIDLRESDEEKLTLVDLAWLVVSVVFVLTLCRMINLAMS